MAWTCGASCAPSKSTQGWRGCRWREYHDPAVREESVPVLKQIHHAENQRALIATYVERREDSEGQIIADDLNTVYFGNNAYGVEAAGETYFNKSIEDLNIAESATPVGLVWSPSTLGEDREGAQYQRNLVLKAFDTATSLARTTTRPSRRRCRAIGPRTRRPKRHFRNPHRRREGAVRGPTISKASRSCPRT